MRKLQLTAYKVDLSEGSEEVVDVKRLIRSILFSPQHSLTMEQALEAGRVFDLISPATDEALLEEADYKLLLDAASALKGFGMIELEFLRRLRGAVEVSVIEDSRQNVCE